MTDIFISSDNILSPIGISTAENFLQLKQNVSAIKIQDDIGMSEQPFYAALFDNDNSFSKTDHLLPMILRNISGKGKINPRELKPQNVSNNCYARTRHYKGLIFRYQASTLIVIPLKPSDIHFLWTEFKVSPVK